MSAAKKTPAYHRYMRKLRWERAGVLAAQFAILAVVLLLWEIAAERYWVNPMLTSRPTQVWETFWRLAASGSLARHVTVTLMETMVGFVIGMTLGVLVAIALWWWSTLARIADPYLVVLNAMPKIALGPIFYVWLGNVHSIYGMAVAISVVVTIAMAYNGFTEVDKAQLKLMETFGASRWQMLQKVVLPASLPTLMATVKVNIGLTLVGVIVGEFISSRAGLGYLIIYGGQVFQMELVMTAIAILLVISALMYLGVTWLEALIARVFHVPIRREH